MQLIWLVNYINVAKILLLHRLGGDPSKQETLRLWDSGVRLKPTGQAVYLGQIADEVLIQRMKVFSYWSAVPAPQASLGKLSVEAAGLHIRRGSDSMLLISDLHIPENGVALQATLATAPAGR